MKAIIFIEASGKSSTWLSICHQLQIDATLVATAGHPCRFPASMSPLGIRLSKGQAIDVARKIRPEIELRIKNALSEWESGTRILIATDDDPEGDVIALDIMRVIVDMDPSLVNASMRIRPGAITRQGITKAIEKANRIGGGIDEIVTRAVSGRTRALTDRWMGATFSRIVQASCGRARAGLLGSALCWSKSPELVRSLPETGEITFQARSAAGGLPFTSFVPFNGKIPHVLANIAKRYSGRLLPGFVTPIRPAGAQIAPRFGHVTPFDTGSILVHASRFHGIKPGKAMAGLQAAYMRGRISYPRTDNCSLSENSATNVVQAARFCGLRDVDMIYASRHAHDERDDSTITSHEGIFPTPRQVKEDIDAFRELILTPIQEVDQKDPDDVEDVMTTLVSRRAFESLRSNELVPGHFHSREDSDLTAEEKDALSDLEWMREKDRAVPWGRSLTTNMRIWPLSSIIVEGMVIENIGRPSTYAAHADLLESSGQLYRPDPSALPEPSPAGRRILKKLPRGTWWPGTCRMIEKSMHEMAPQEELDAQITRRMRQRVDEWFARVDEEVRSALVKELMNEEKSGRHGVEVSLGIQPDDPDHGSLEDSYISMDM